jgi:hypothetical protein
MNNNKYELNASLNKIGGYEEELYKQKYLKYKQKYLKLKAQMGGGHVMIGGWKCIKNWSDIKKVLPFSSELFYHHILECEIKDENNLTEIDMLIFEVFNYIIFTIGGCILKKYPEIKVRPTKLASITLNEYIINNAYSTTSAIQLIVPGYEHDKYNLLEAFNKVKDDPSVNVWWKDYDQFGEKYVEKYILKGDINTQMLFYAKYDPSKLL